MSQTATWGTHVFGVYLHEASWNHIGGVYIFAGISPQNRWVPLYIGQTDSFRNRIPLHEQWLPARRLGATHVHAMVAAQAATERAGQKICNLRLREPKQAPQLEFTI